MYMYMYMCADINGNTCGIHKGFLCIICNERFKCIIHTKIQHVAQQRDPDAKTQHTA